MQINSKRIETAIDNTIELSKSGAIPPQYFENTLASRQPGGLGSVFNTKTSKEDLCNANWTEYSHPDVMSGCTAFKTTDICGRLGVVKLEDLPQDSLVSLEDPKGTGKVSAVVSAEGIIDTDVNFTVIILGMEGGREIVFTFHPGEPISPSRVPSQGQTGSISIPVALDLGLEYAKLDY